MRQLLSKLLGDPNEKTLKRLGPKVAAINDLESQLEKLSDKQLKEQTPALRKRLEAGATLDDLLPEAFATVREAARRALGVRYYDVQLLGGMVLHGGNIAEMRTGEGKTFVASLPAYLNALTGDGVHIVTVNDYLASRDAGWLGPVYQALGLQTAVITSGNTAYIFDPEHESENHDDERLRRLKPIDKKEAYQADVLYGTNNEFGFDYLRDNMRGSLEQMVQRKLSYAIVDEVDSILIDEARTPLIISAPAMAGSDTYQQFAGLARQLLPEQDYVVDEKSQAANLTDDGVNHVEQMLGISDLYDQEKVQIIYHLEQALKAEALFRIDRDYVVREGQVIIVDQFTGRLLHGRRYNEGLHQAIEAKEGVSIQQESVTLATISFQNYFRLYQKLAGMTGTAKTEEEEFQNIYGLDVIAIPPNRPNQREDLTDRVYKTEAAKTAAIVADVKERHQKGQPILIGTVSIQKNEHLSALLKKEKIKHEVLNAKNNEREAAIIAQAGQYGQVTLATNIAGRGTDIVLGEGVTEVGGLHVLGSERHEARRIDNQLRGRAGRQGDPGSTQFYVSFEDDLMRIFGGERLSGLMSTLGIDENIQIENALVSRTIESAQKKVESHNYDIRKHVLQYDDVMNKQRDTIYKRRRALLERDDLSEETLAVIEDELRSVLTTHVEDDEKALEIISAILPFVDLKLEEFQKMEPAERQEKLLKVARIEYERRRKEYGPEVMRDIERWAHLSTIDRLWMAHLETMEHMREGTRFQQDPLAAYKKEGFQAFNRLKSEIDREVATTIFRVEARPVAQAATEEVKTDLTAAAEEAQVVTEGGALRKAAKPKSQKSGKVGRNDPCPCGSGLKYKKCGLINAPEHRG